MTIVCIGCALVVSGAAGLLKEQQQFAEKIDTYKNVLIAAGLVRRGEAKPPKDIEKMYTEGIVGLLIDVNGNVAAESTDQTPESVHKQDKILAGTPGYIEPAKRTYPLYTIKKDGKPDGYIVPVYGQGLWSALYGYLALEADGKTIRNLVFYKEGETPGLGKEITKSWFQDQFQKKTFIENDQITFTVGRPGKVPDEPTHVAGISGATITGRGVQKMMVDKMKLYQPYFEKTVWKKSS